MPTPSFPIDPAVVQARLRQLLFALLEQNGCNPYPSAAVIPADVDLTAVGITSIDFLEFALSAEQQFQVSILDTIEPDELPLTLAEWQQQVCERSTSPGA